MWQECPVCKGSGKKANSEATGFVECNVCKGKGIINETTGNPPSGDKGSSSKDVLND